ncbi:MAG TPA: pullulanase-associated domain-containing protein [Albitalea sp.]|nr:pullulanase-associated domain-containing protein [Albitalea sp.]
MSTTRFLLQTLVAGVIAAGAAGAAVAQTSLPEGKVAIHYNRCDNNYEGWGAHLWKDPGIPLSGVEWQKPMQPTGKDDFGVFWVVDLKDFGSKGKVNYIIHKGDSKDQGGRDMSFDGTAHKEIWVDNGDRKIYTSLDDAKKARAENPCK